VKNREIGLQTTNIKESYNRKQKEITYELKEEYFRFLTGHVCFDKWDNFFCLENY